MHEEETNQGKLVEGKWVPEAGLTGEKVSLGGRPARAHASGHAQLLRGVLLQLPTT